MLFDNTKVSIEDVRNELESRASEKIYHSIRMPTRLLAEYKKLSIDTGISVSKILCFVLEQGIDKLHERQASK